MRKLSYKRNKIDSNSLDITGEIVIPPMKQSVNYITQLKLKHKLLDNGKINKKLSYRRVTARCVLSVVILPITTQQCRNYLYDKS